MKPKLKFLGIFVVMAFLIATLLPADPALATPAPDPDADQSSSERHEDSPLPREGTTSNFDAVWSSNWISLMPGEGVTLAHNLGGDWEDYAVQLWFLDTDAGGYGVNNRAYGRLEDDELHYGASWQGLTSDAIVLYRASDDTMADKVRVWIWPSQYSPTPYCTAWANILQGETVTVNHNLGGNVDDYVVKLWFRNPAFPWDVNQIYYGGAEVAGLYLGAYWQGLDTTSVKVTRLDDDTSAEEFLLCVGLTDPPAWDSGWVDILPDQTKTLPHNLGVNINRYIVRMEFKQLPREGSPEAPLGIHLLGYGGDASNTVAEDYQYLGANWQNLTNQTIDVYRWANDPYADQVRVRIWLRRPSVYLPVVFKNHP